MALCFLDPLLRLMKNLILNKTTERYLKQEKKVHLIHLSADCQKLLKNADKIIDVNVIEDPSYKVVVDSL
jgi:SulP family sulfate permease